MNPHADVLAFMKIGQPESCPDTLQPLDAPPVVVRELRDSAALLLLAASRLQKLNHPLAFRARLMTEELGETLQAMGDGNMEEVADGMVDLEYVTVGTAITLGIPHEECWRAVQAANLGKYIRCATCRGVGAHFPSDLCTLFAKLQGSEHGAALVNIVFEHYAYGEDAHRAWMDARLYATAADRDTYPLLHLAFRDVQRIYTVFAQHRAEHTCGVCAGKGYNVLRDAQGKIQKPPGWSPPDIKGILQRFSGVDDE